MTRSTALLAAAATFDGPFTYSDLAVRAWERDPDLFSLDGHDYPDSYKVRWIMTAGDRGLLRRGYFASCGGGRLELTQLGRDAAQGGQRLTMYNARARNVEQMASFLVTKLFCRWAERSFSFIADTDVISALRVSPKGHPLHRRAKYLRRVISDLRERALGGAVAARGGCTVSLHQLDRASACLDWCERRFAELFVPKTPRAHIPPT